MSRKDQNHYRSFDQGRKNGWGIGLYRHPSDGWFGGVCAGLAEYWEVPTWVTRLSAFALFLFTGSIIFWFYIAAWILISKRSTRWGGEVHEGEVIKTTMRIATNTADAQPFVTPRRHQRAWRRPTIA